MHLTQLSAWSESWNIRLTDAAVFHLWHRTSVASVRDGGPVLCIIYGIPFVAVYNDSYTLSGERQNWGPFQCATVSAAGTWHFGAVVASPEMVRHPSALVLAWSNLSYPVCE